MPLLFLLISVLEKLLSYESHITWIWKYPTARNKTCIQTTTFGALNFNIDINQYQFTLGHKRSMLLMCKTNNVAKQSINIQVMSVL